MEIALKLLGLLICVAGVGLMIVRDMEKQSTTEVAGWTLNVPASVTAGSLALVVGGIAVYFLFN